MFGGPGGWEIDEEEKEKNGNENVNSVDWGSD